MEKDKMIKTKVNHTGGITVEISSNKPLEKNDLEYIQNLNSTIYWSDDLLKNYIFDQKLPSGAWLENCNFNNDLTEAQALIFN